MVESIFAHTVPGAPANCSSTILLPRQATLVWIPPQNQEITGYTLNCSLFVISIAPTRTTINITNILPYTAYTCTLTAQYNDVSNPPVNCDFETPQDSKYSNLHVSTQYVY